MKFKSVVSLAVGLAACFLVTQAYADPVKSDVQLNGDDANSVIQWTGTPAGFTYLLSDSSTQSGNVIYSAPVDGITFGLQLDGTKQKPASGTWDFTWSGNTTDVTADLYVVVKSTNESWGFLFQGVSLSASVPQSFLDNLWKVTFGNTGFGSMTLYVGNIAAVPTGGGGNAVPEPATMLLFGTGLLGLAGIARRKQS